jgi:rhodanese-related sulfurtransferase
VKERLTMATEVTVSDLALALEDNAWLLDVREEWEYNDAHVPGAHLIPLNDLPNRLSEVADGERVFVICAAGGRSQTAADYLLSRGIDCVSVAGGTNGWIASGRPVESN